MGTVRVHSRRSMSVSLVNMSVIGFLVYLSAYGMVTKGGLQCCVIYPMKQQVRASQGAFLKRM